MWTLQEACIRPDLWFANNNWELLGTAEYMPLNLFDLTLLVTSMQITGPVPPVVQELKALLKDTRIGEISLFCERSTILSMANSRYCQEGRQAEAIMSAIGATDWFQKVDHGSIVCKLYPIAFVREVRDKIGSGEFFRSTPIEESSKVLEHLVAISDLSQHDSNTYPWPLGTMMPFASEVRNVPVSPTT